MSGPVGPSAAGGCERPDAADPLDAADRATAAAPRRIIVALDASPDGRTALRAALDLAGPLDARVEAVHVEDEHVVRAASLSLVREQVTVAGGRRRVEHLEVRRELRVQARRLREDARRIAQATGRRLTFRHERGPVRDVLHEAAEEADIVAAGVRGRSRIRGAGRTARTLAFRARAPVLLATQGKGRARSVTVAWEGSPGAERALRLGMRLAAALGGGMCVLEVGPGAATGDERLRERLEPRLRAAGIRASFVPAARGAAGVARRLGDVGPGLLVAPRRLVGGGRAELDSLLRASLGPVVVVGEAA